MKHHEYQIYYGGFKKKLKNAWYCEDCDSVTYPYGRFPLPNPKYHVRSHKKRKGKPLPGIKFNLINGIRNSAYEKLSD